MCKHTSTTHALINFQNTIVRQINDGFPVQAIFLDIEKAFDTIEGLVYKMIRLGFDKTVCRYILFYASNRNFAIKINSFISEYYPIPNGLPQGAIFSPTGWAIYVADIPIFPRVVGGSIVKLSQYADDTAIMAFNWDHDYARLGDDLNEYLAQILAYCTKWRIKLNKTKTERITCVGYYKATKYKHRKKAKNLLIKIDGEKIENKSQVKYLGLIITPNLESYRHIDHIIKKVDTAFAKLKNIFSSKYINANVKVLAYKTLIRPIITYAANCYFQTSSYQIERLRRKERQIF